MERREYLVYTAGGMIALAGCSDSEVDENGIEASPEAEETEASTPTEDTTTPEVTEEEPAPKDLAAIEQFVVYPNDSGDLNETSVASIERGNNISVAIELQLPVVDEIYDAFVDVRLEDGGEVHDEETSLLSEFSESESVIRTLEVSFSSTGLDLGTHQIVVEVDVVNADGGTFTETQEFELTDPLAEELESVTDHIEEAEKVISEAMEAYEGYTDESLTATSSDNFPTADLLQKIRPAEEELNEAQEYDLEHADVGDRIDSLDTEITMYRRIIHTQPDAIDLREQALFLFNAIDSGSSTVRSSHDRYTDNINSFRLKIGGASDDSLENVLSELRGADTQRDYGNIVDGFDAERDVFQEFDQQAESFQDGISELDDARREISNENYNQAQLIAEDAKNTFENVISTLDQVGRSSLSSTAEDMRVLVESHESEAEDVRRESIAAQDE